MNKSVRCAATVLAGFALSALLLSCTSGGSSDSGGGGGSQSPAGSCAPTGSGQLTICTPTQGAAVPAGPVSVTFLVQGFTIGLPGQTHLHFYMDNDPEPHHFYDGPGITSDNGVLYKGFHTHSVHWTGPRSFDLFGLAAGPHQVQLVLADASDVDVAGTTPPLQFTVSAPAAGTFGLQGVITGLDTSLGMVMAPDGRIFFTEFLSGNIRIINPGWQSPAAFATLPIGANGPEQGLIGITLDPDFPNNHYVYVFHTIEDSTKNRVVRFTEVNGVGTNLTIILDNLPAYDFHNGGNLHFGPDGKLYVTIGDANEPALAQDLGSLNGKLLRINADGSIPGDNPVPGSPVYAHGLRNSFDFTFHPHTGDLWATENSDDNNDEINRIVGGGNYGWPLYVGIANDPPFRDPILTFTPTIAPTAILTIPEGSAYPAQYHNNLLFADANTGRLHRIELAGGDLRELGASSVAYPGGQGPLVGMFYGLDGYIYVTNFGSIFRVVVN
ncbi:MAG: PQQ-dependent sugar dehydrogenase [Nitrospira sp. CG24D]|nr:MAG: PQQ-dependent sugar dehydrogenase [Nitrospira sp. CG24D]TKB80965.1 MAG: PQQ-dependent sugar dehydrogenase [Nitrospira sp.]